MKRFLLVFSLLFICLFYACTDVPLSYNTHALNRRILGYWQPNDSIAVCFTENASRDVFLSNYSYEADKGSFVRKGDPSKVYFTNLVIGAKNYQFLSVKNNDESYTNYIYSFSYAGRLEMGVISTALPYSNKKAGGSIDTFGTPQNLQRYVREKTGTAGFYEKIQQLNARSSFTALHAPFARTVEPLASRPVAPSYPSTNFAHYAPKFGTVSFDYPSGWEVGQPKDPKVHAFNENYFIQPRGQYFSGNSGEVVIRIFDPASIGEDARAMSTAFSQTLFDGFVSSISDGVHLSSRLVSVNGATYYECTQQNQNYSLRHVGVRSASGNLRILSMAAAPTISNENNAILYQVAQSIHGAEPGAILNQQELAVFNWYKALGQGNVAQVKQLSCASALMTSGVISLFSDGDTESAIIGAARAYNFSHLSFYMIGTYEDRAVVRVCGNVVGPGGDIKPFFQYARLSGGSNLFVVRREQGGWKLCEPVQGRSN